MVAPIKSPEALRVNFSGSASIRTWSLTSWASSIAWLKPWVVVLAFTLKVIFGVGTSSSEGSSVGIVKFRLYFPVIVTSNLPVLSSRDNSTASSLPARLRSFRSSLMFMHIFVGSVDTYS